MTLITPMPPMTQLKPAQAPRTLTPPTYATSPPRPPGPDPRDPRGPPEPPGPPRRHPVLVFSPLAWLKLQFFCHAGRTEVGGFAVSAGHDPLYLEQFVTVRQATTAAGVRF